ncbi:50S ribosomal protein L29, chloroplastic [Lotus japonicus]|uniref:Large ribosomal subunit protein uL29c n=1 Tax=Lotus japonicus TaxID=34305 RepID=I3S488_LOTJA|nr:50S ribosomal protein L29, chloroplastic [Lotus japonicus]AFK35080.1 unknown [Lotus japonicus]
MLSLSVASPSSSTVSFLPKPLPFKSSFNGNQLRHSATCSIPATKRTVSVVMMAKREVELKAIREMTTEQIEEEVIDLKGELFMLRLQKSARNEFKPSDFGTMRKRIARMLTVKREREIEAGIGKRLSRKLDKKWKRSIVVRPPPSLKKLQEEEAAAEAAEAEKAA